MSYENSNTLLAVAGALAFSQVVCRAVSANHLNLQYLKCGQKHERHAHFFKLMPISDSKVTRVEYLSENDVTLV